MRTLEEMISPTDRQREFLSVVAEKRFVLYGGAAGGGKSYILRWWLVKYLIELAQRGVKNAQVGLFCEDYPSLIDRHVSKIRFEFPSELGSIRQQPALDYVLHERLGGGRIALRNLDDPSKYLSSEFAAIAVDELTRNPKSVFDFLRLRLRWPGIDLPRFGAGTNPGGIGHPWVKAIWIDGRMPPELLPLAKEFGFVQAKADDNPHLTEQYRRDLEALPPAMRRAYAEGSWDIFAGQYFDCFDRAKSVLPAQSIKLESWWTRWVSVDWGFDHPSAVYWHSYDGTTIYTYREFVRSRLTPRELASEIVSRSDGEKITQIYLSPDAFAQRSSPKTIALEMDEVLIEGGLPRVSMADNDRVGGWMLMYSLLRDGGWGISDSCIKLIDCLPSLVRDENRLEDVAKMDGDDPADAVRYGLKSYYRAKDAPIEVRIARRVTSDDPTVRGIQALVAAQKEKQRLRAFIPQRYRGQHGENYV